MPNTTVAYQCNDLGVYLGETIAQEDPLDPDNFLLPPYATIVPPPTVVANQQAVFSNGAWSLQNTPVPVTPESAPLTVQQAQDLALSTLYAAYISAITQPIAYTTAAGVSKVFQTDQNSQNFLVQATQGYMLDGRVPSGFYWVSSDNVQVPFALEDLKGLYAEMLAQGWAAFQKLQTLKAQVNAATTVGDVAGVLP